MTTDRSRRVILMIDYDNLQICASRDAPGTDLDLHAVMELAQSYGTVVVARAYAEWNMAAERLAVYKVGIEPIFAPVLRTDSRGRVEGKSLCDTVMVAEGVDLLWTLSPDVLVLVTSDKDLIPLARVARQRGASVVVIGSDLTAVQLVEMCNVLITYRQLLKDLGKTPDAAPPSTPSRGTRERGRGIAERSYGDRERTTERPAVDRRPRDRDRDAVPAAPAFASVETVPNAPDFGADELPRGDELGSDDSPAARRRRRRRGRSRLDEAAVDGGEMMTDAVAETATDTVAEPLEVNGNGRAAETSAYVPTAELSDLPTLNGQPDESPVSEPAEADAPAPRAPRRRRRTPSSAAVADAPAETSSTES